MNLYVVGVNYKTAPIQIREKFSIGEQEYDKVLSGIRLLDHVTECALLSTCNRTELHIYTELACPDTGFIEARFCQLKGLNHYEVKKYFTIYEGTSAIRHIMKVASGMDSMILGEDQILGQFKRAYEISMKQGTSKAVLNTLSRLAITSSKKIKTRKISAGKASTVAVQAGELLSGIFGKDLALKKVLVIGSGEIGKMVAAELACSGVPDVYMTRRYSAGTEAGAAKEAGVGEKAGAAGNSIVEENSAATAGQSKVRYIDYNDRYTFVDQCDIIIGATSSPHYTITRDMIEKKLGNRHIRRIFIDLAVPRDFDENIRQIENISVFNIDDLKTITCNKAKGTNLLDIGYIQEQINCVTEEFLAWLQRRNFFLCKEEA